MAGPWSLHGSSAKAPHLCMQNARSPNKHVRNLRSPWSGSGSGTRCIIASCVPKRRPSVTKLLGPADGLRDCNA